MKNEKGLTFDLVFGGDGNTHPPVQEATAVIKDDAGRAIFEQEGVIAPKHWSQQAINVVASKYFYGPRDAPPQLDPSGGGREHNVWTLVGRVVRTIAGFGVDRGYFRDHGATSDFVNELEGLCLGQYGSFNSPVWFNVGLSPFYGIRGGEEGYGWRWDEQAEAVVPLREGEAYKYPQVSACFIQSVKDNLQDIYARAVREGMLFKYGSGTGTDNSTIRSTREAVNGGGTPSGPVSFMGIYDAVAKVTKSGGKCLAPDQPVFTAGGIRTVRELAERGEDFTVLSYSRRERRVVARTARAWASGKKEVWALVTDKGEFLLSADHPVMRRTGDFVEVRHLRPGMSLMATKTYAHPDGYVSVGLQPSLVAKLQRELLHRLVARDVKGWPVEGRVVHHGEDGKDNSEPGNLTLLEDQGAHASLHGRELAVKGAHVFQRNRFPKPGAANGMHAGSDFWKDEAKAAGYRARQSAVLVASGRARSMQRQSSPAKMLNLGYQLINAGHDISTFEGYYEARKAVVGKIGNSKAQLLEKFRKQFGGYDAYYAALRAGNHEVVALRRVGVMPVYDVEVDAVGPDEGMPWDEHNFAIVPVGQSSSVGTCLYVHNTRRAAKMETLKVAHPDVLEFIECKSKEEAKARGLISAGFDGSFNGEVYQTVNFQNSNTALRVTDAFMRKATGEDLDARWQTIAVTTGKPECDGKPMPVYDAEKLLRRAAECNWDCGDPGLQFEDTIQRWHACPVTAPINSSNPCSEYMFIDESACNLASLNLKKFLKEDGTFDAEAFVAAVEAFITAQEILVDLGSYPTKEIAQNSHDYRPLGLGYCNLGGLLMSMGIPYDSNKGRALCALITSLMTAAAYRQSAWMARAAGPYPGFEKNRRAHLAVLRQHAEATPRDVPADFVDLRKAADAMWENAIEHAEEYGLRNAQVTVLAPTGTIAFMMDADTTGIEPDLGLVKYKQLAGGGVLKIVNNSVKRALEALWYDKPQLTHSGTITADAPLGRILAHIEAHGTIEGCSELKAEDLPVFDCAFPPLGGAKQLADGRPIEGRSLHYRAHLRMMAAAQPFLSGAISKTVNLPHDATVDDFFNAYVEAWKLGLKAVALYRDGCKGSQPLSTKEAKDAAAPARDPDDGGDGGDPVGVPGGVRGPAPDSRELTRQLRDVVALTYDFARKLGIPIAEPGLQALRDIQAAQLNGDANARVPDGGGAPAALHPAGDQPSHPGLPAAATLDSRGLQDPGGAGHRGQGLPADPHEARRDGDGDGQVQGRDDQAVLHQPVSPCPPARHKLPSARLSVTFKFDVGQHGGYVNAGLYDDGSPGELFITMDKEGSIVAGLMDALATSCSIGMQYGVPLEAFVRKFAFTAYEPNGFTGDPDVPRAHSLVDYIFRKLGILFVPGYREEMQGGPGSPQKPSDPRAALVVDMARAGLATGQPGPPSDLVLAMEPYAAQAPWKTFEIRPLTAGDLNHLERQADLVQARVGEPPVRESSVDRLVRVFGLPDRTAKHAPKTVTAEHGPPCDTCGHLMVRCGACYRCENCGSQGGCG